MGCVAVVLSCDVRGDFHHFVVSGRPCLVVVAGSDYRERWRMANDVGEQWGTHIEQSAMVGRGSFFNGAAILFVVCCIREC